MASYSGERTKSRAKVKPILRKLTQSEKNSLDLDRPAAEQDGLGIYDYGLGMASRSSHDIAFVPGRRAYHARSTSGTSQFSTGTAGSGQRAGSFVHPFQQTPRPYTPPLVGSSYPNSLRESEPAVSPALTEDEDPLRHHNFQIRSPSNLSNHRSPSLTAASASTPIITQPLRIQTKQPPSASRLALTTSHTSLHTPTHPGSLLLSHELSASSPDAMSPTSALRTSIDKGFRIRSRSELDPPFRPETIQEARRKFHEKELAKEEKAAREEIRALEKRQQKEARQIERSHRRSSASDATRSKRSKSDLTLQEKGDGFLGREYGTALPANSLPEEYVAPRRSGTAKQKTHSTWTKFMMWLRTRFLRMSSGSKKQSRR